MNQRQQKIIDTFLKENPAYKKVTYDESVGGVIVFFAHKPNEPFTVSEFVPGSPTQRVLSHINTLLRGAEGYD